MRCAQAMLEEGALPAAGRVSVHPWPGPTRPTGLTPRATGAAPAIALGEVENQHRRIFALIREFNVLAARGAAAADLSRLVASIKNEVQLNIATERCVPRPGTRARRAEHGKTQRQILEHLARLQETLHRASPPAAAALAHAMDTLIVAYYSTDELFDAPLPESAAARRPTN